MMWMYLGLFLIGGAAAQIPVLGGCPKVKTMENFDITQYVGKWYEAERYFTIFEMGGKCISANYTLNDNGTVSVLNRQISSLSGVVSSISGFATQNNTDKAKLSVVFPSMPIQIAAPLWVLETDYSSYAVVWSCNDMTIVSARSVWILTRAQQPEVSVLEKAYQVLDKNKISRAFLVRVDQKNCPKETESNEVA